MYVTRILYLDSASLVTSILFYHKWSPFSALPPITDLLAASIALFNEAPLAIATRSWLFNEKKTVRLGLREKIANTRENMIGRSSYKKLIYRLSHSSIEKKNKYKTLEPGSEGNGQSSALGSSPDS